MAERIPISRVLGALLDEATAERVSLGWLMNRLGERSFDIILRNEEFRAVAQLCRGCLHRAAGRRLPRRRRLT